MSENKCYIIETNHTHVEYQKTILICKTRELAEHYLPIVKKELKKDTLVDIPLRITEKTFFNE